VDAPRNELDPFFSQFPAHVVAVGAMPSTGRIDEFDLDSQLGNLIPLGAAEQHRLGWSEIWY
jgi:hypothetical protein